MITKCAKLRTPTVEVKQTQKFQEVEDELNLNLQEYKMISRRRVGLQSPWVEVELISNLQEYYIYNCISMIRNWEKLRFTDQKKS